MGHLKLTGKQLQEYIDKRTNAIIESLIKHKTKQDTEETLKENIKYQLTNYVTEMVFRKLGVNKLSKMNEAIGNGLYAEIRFVQRGDDDYEEIERMFCGEQDGYCEANSQPVIDYLKQWDSDENEITPNEPRIARYDTSYADENGDYVLLYNSSIGGCFLLYRPANEHEIDWYNDNGPGSMGESKRRNTSKYVNETIE